MKNVDRPPQTPRRGREKWKSAALCFLWTLELASPSVSFAQYPAPLPATQVFAGFNPTILADETEAKRLFDGLETGFKTLRPYLLQFGTECTQRAHLWSYEMEKLHQVVSQKIFIFYTLAYHEFYRKNNEKRFPWWFHVAPYVLVNPTQELVLDRSFAEGPLTMKDWTDLFVESKQPCIENVPYSEFEGDVTGQGKSHNPSAHCYLVRAPMMDMFPLTIEARQNGEISEYEWDLRQVYRATRALRAEPREKYRDRVGL